VSRVVSPRPTTPACWIAAHQQLGGPIVLIWDNLDTHISVAMRALIAAGDWLRGRTANAAWAISPFTASTTWLRTRKTGSNASSTGPPPSVVWKPPTNPLCGDADIPDWGCVVTVKSVETGNSRLAIWHSPQSLEPSKAQTEHVRESMPLVLTRVQT
jgi:hypothetical protein